MIGENIYMPAQSRHQLCQARLEFLSRRAAECQHQKLCGFDIFKQEERGHFVYQNHRFSAARTCRNQHPLTFIVHSNQLLWTQMTKQILVFCLRQRPLQIPFFAGEISLDKSWVGQRKIIIGKLQRLQMLPQQLKFLMK